MRGIWMAAIIGFGFGAGAARADVPRVAVDIAPVHSIVAAVMGALGTPDLIIPTGASPHDHQLRPSEARVLSQADVLIWVGPGLTPWLAGPAETLAGGAENMALVDVPKTVLLDMRTGATFGAHDHSLVDEPGDHGDHEDDAEHDDHDAEHEDHDAEHDDHDGHGDQENHEAQDDSAVHSDHGGVDPHVWLDPQNAMVWADAIAGVFARYDPENKEIYAENSMIFANSMAELDSEINAVLDPVRGRPFVVFHDAYHYFENRFDIEAIGAVTANDASAPSPARLSELKSSVAATGAVCALSEPQFNPGLLTALGEVQLGEIDPIGAALTPGPALYPEMLRNMAGALAACLE